MKLKFQIDLFNLYFKLESKLSGWKPDYFIPGYPPHAKTYLPFV
jgi:hypothetical protein